MCGREDGIQTQVHTEKPATSSLPDQRSGASQRSNLRCLQLQSPASGGQSLTEQPGPFQKERWILPPLYYWQVKLSQLLQTHTKQGPRAISESWLESCVLIKRKEGKCHPKNLSPNGSRSTFCSRCSDVYILCKSKTREPHLCILLPTKVTPLFFQLKPEVNTLIDKPFALRGWI